MPSSKGSSLPRDRTQVSRIEPETVMSPALAGGFFTTSATWEAQDKAYSQWNSSIVLSCRIPEVQKPSFILSIVSFSPSRQCFSWYNPVSVPGLFWAGCRTVSLGCNCPVAGVETPAFSAVWIDWGSTISLVSGSVLPFLLNNFFFFPCISLFSHFTISSKEKPGHIFFLPHGYPVAQNRLLKR